MSDTQYKRFPDNGQTMNAKQQCTRSNKMVNCLSSQVIKPLMDK